MKWSPVLFVGCLLAVVLATQQAWATPTTHQVNWAMNHPQADLRVSPGDQVAFQWVGVHDVRQFSNKEAFDRCDFSQALMQAQRSPWVWTVPTTTAEAGDQQQPQEFYFGCGVNGHCSRNFMKLKVIVETPDIPAPEQQEQPLQTPVVPDQPGLAPQQPSSPGQADPRLVQQPQDPQQLPQQQSQTQLSTPTQADQQQQAPPGTFQTQTPGNPMTQTQGSPLGYQTQSSYQYPPPPSSPNSGVPVQEQQAMPALFSNLLQAPVQLLYYFTGGTSGQPGGTAVVIPGGGLPPVAGLPPPPPGSLPAIPAIPVTTVPPTGGGTTATTGWSLPTWLFSGAASRDGSVLGRTAATSSSSSDAHTGFDGAARIIPFKGRSLKLDYCSPLQASYPEHYFLQQLGLTSEVCWTFNENENWIDLAYITYLREPEWIAELHNETQQQQPQPPASSPSELQPGEVQPVAPEPLQDPALTPQGQDQNIIGTQPTDSAATPDAQVTTGGPGFTQTQAERVAPAQGQYPSGYAGSSQEAPQLRQQSSEPSSGGPLTGKQFISPLRPEIQEYSEPSRVVTYWRLPLWDPRLLEQQKQEQQQLQQQQEELRGSGQVYLDSGYP